MFHTEESFWSTVNAAATCSVELLNTCFSKISLYPRLASLGGNFDNLLFLEAAGKYSRLMICCLTFSPPSNIYIFRSLERFPAVPPVLLKWWMLLLPAIAGSVFSLSSASFYVTKYLQEWFWHESDTNLSTQCIHISGISWLLMNQPDLMVLILAIW